MRYVSKIRKWIDIFNEKRDEMLLLKEPYVVLEKK